LHDVLLWTTIDAAIVPRWTIVLAPATKALQVGASELLLLKRACPRGWYCGHFVPQSLRDHVVCASPSSPRDEHQTSDAAALSAALLADRKRAADAQLRTVAVTLVGCRTVGRSKQSSKPAVPGARSTPEAVTPMCLAPLAQKGQSGRDRRVGDKPEANCSVEPG